MIKKDGSPKSTADAAVTPSTAPRSDPDEIRSRFRVDGQSGRLERYR
jgi:hypothetical protein